MHNNMVTRRALGTALLGAFALSTVAAPAKAQQRLPETVVSATRTATPPDQIGSSTTVITRREIEEGDYRDVVELLQGVAGINIVQSGGRGKQTSIFTRGSESNHTLILLNGARLVDSSSTGGIFQIEHLNTADIERIEIVRGPQSVLYGSDAIGGVINIITRRGTAEDRDGVVFAGSFEGGDLHTTEWRGGVDADVDWFTFNAHTSLFRTDGISSISPRVGGLETDAYDNHTSSIRVGVRPADWLRASFYSQFIEVENDLDPFVDDPNAADRYRQGLFISEIELVELADGLLNTTFRHSYLGINRRIINPPDFMFRLGSAPQRFVSDKHKIEVINTIRLPFNNRLTLGQEVEWERGKAQGSFLTFSNETRNAAFYVQDQFALWNRLFGTVGFRIDDHSRFGTQYTWRATGAYHLRETNTRLKASAGTGFKAPSLEDLFGFNPGFPPFFPPFVGNPNLEPERSLGFDVGVEQDLLDGRVTVGSTFFYNRLRDLIQPNQAFTTTVNVRRARTFGIESFARVDLSGIFDRPLSARLTHTFLRAEDTSTDTELLRRPRNKLTFDLRAVPFERLTVNFRLVYTGFHADVDFVTFGRIYRRGFVVARIAAEYRINDNVAVFGRVENLFDNRFENPDGFNQPRIAGYAGIRLRLAIPRAWITG